LAKEQKDAAKQPSSQGRGRFDALRNPRKIAPFDHDPAIPTLAAGTAVAPAYAPMRSPLGPNGQAVPAPRFGSGVGRRYPARPAQPILL